MPSSAKKNCPFCKEEVLAEAILCKHCRSKLGDEPPTHGGTCPFCKEAINEAAIRCKHCLSDVGPKSACDCHDSPGAGGAGLEVALRAAQGGLGLGAGGSMDGRIPSCTGYCDRHYRGCKSFGMPESYCYNRLVDCYLDCSGVPGLAFGRFIA